MSDLLERIFSDFGLIVCGWSADWDGALRAVLSQNASRAYSTFWAVRGEPSDSARQVLGGRNGKAVIMIDSADSFFHILEEKVDAIRQVLERPALTADLARATLERYLENPYTNRIRIRHLVLREIEAVLPWLNAHVYSPQTPPPSGEFASEMSELLMELGPTIAMLVAGGRWGEREQHETWRGALERVLDASHGHIFELRWNGYWAYAAYVILYAAGIAAVSGERYETLAALFASETTEGDISSPRVLAVWALRTR